MGVNLGHGSGGGEGGRESGCWEKGWGDVLDYGKTNQEGLSE